jgi:hypothetical protein
MARATSDRPPEAAALDYLSRGWSVVPVGARSKRPIIAWQPYQRQRALPNDVTHWFARWPDANVGIVTGRVSSLVVLDVDVAHGGAETFERLLDEHGPLPATVEAVSGGGGRHLYFAHPGGSIPNRVELFRGIDLRGDGGVIVAPPSVHPSGGRYRWLPGHGPGSLDPAPMPDWLLRAAAPSAAGTGHPPTYWRTLISEGVAEGGRNNAIASLSGHLLHHDVDEQVVIELLLCWNRVRCRPPLADEEVVRTVLSIVRTQQRHADER